LLAHSTALLADSLDMLGDSLVYGYFQDSSTPEKPVFDRMSLG